MNIHIPSAASIRTVTHIELRLDHAQYDDNKIKCVLLLD